MLKNRGKKKGNTRMCDTMREESKLGMWNSENDTARQLLFDGAILGCVE